MILIYLDESGDTGTNYNDSQQPIFVLGAMLIDQDKWKVCEENFLEIILNAFDGAIPDSFEFHTMDLVNRNKWFSNFSIEQSKKLRNTLLEFIKVEKFPVLYRKIVKKDYQKYCEDKYGKGIKIDPYVMAFPFICLGVKPYLERKNDLGIFIIDEHRSIFDIEQSLKTLRQAHGDVLKMERVIEKGFFVDSSKSYPIQMLDLVLYYLRKYEEYKIGKKVSPVHLEVFDLVVSLSMNLDNHNQGRDILEWVDGRIKNEKRLPSKVGPSR